MSDTEQQPEQQKLSAWQVLQRWRLPFAAGQQKTLLAGAAMAFAALVVTALLWLDPWGPPRSGLGPSATGVSAASQRIQATGTLAAGPALAVFIWEDDQGVRRRTAVDAGRFGEYAASRRALIAQDQQRILAVAAQELRNAVRPVFAEMEARVPQYGGWVFDWWTSWILLGRAFGWTAESLFDGPILTLPDRVQAHLVVAIQQQFSAIVLDPKTTLPQLKPAIDRSLRAARDELLQSCRRYEDALREFIRREARTVERSDPAQGWVADAAWDRNKAAFRVACDAPGTLDDATIGAQLQHLLPAMSTGGPVDDVILRMARPFATKLISFVVLPVIVTALVGGFVLPIFGLLPGIISAVITGIITGAAGAAIIGFSASASIDWILNRTDEALSRNRFEADVRKGVTAAELEFESTIVAAQQRSIERQLAEVIAAATGRPPGT